MIRLAFVCRSVSSVGRLNCRWCTSKTDLNLDSNVLEVKIINHLYPFSLKPRKKCADVNASTSPECISKEVSLAPADIFYRSIELTRSHSKQRNENASFLSQAALNQLHSPSLSPLEHDLLLVSAALNSRGSCHTLHPTILSGLEGCKDTVSTLRLLFVAGLTRLRLPPATWRSVQQRLAERAPTLSEADLVALCSASFRCGAPITSGRLQERLAAAARRLAIADGHTGSLVALLKALRLARAPSAPLLDALRQLVARRGARLALPAAAHLAACWCAPPVRDAPLLSALELVLERRLEAFPGGPTPPGGEIRPSPLSPNSDTPPPPPPSPPQPPAAVPDGRPKDVARLLYAFSHLGHTPGQRALELVEQRMAGWSLRQPLPLVDALLSLAILGRYPQQLLERVLTEQVAEQLAGAGRPRQLSRLALLRLAVCLETPLRPPSLSWQLTPAALPAPSLARELRRRPRLTRLLEQLRRRQPAARVALGYPVPHVNTASVLLSWPDGRRAAVELLDGGALLGAPPAEGVPGERGVSAEMGRGAGPGPHCAVGLVRLKARLADKLGYQVQWELGR